MRLKWSAKTVELIRTAVARGVLQESDSIVLRGVGFVGVRDVFADVANSIGYSLSGQFFVHPVFMSPIVFDAFVLTVGLANKHPSFEVTMQRDNIRHIGLGGEEFALERRRVFELSDIFLAFITGGSQRWRLGFRPIGGFR